jgi:hypothetical protein
MLRILIIHFSINFHSYTLQLNSKMVGSLPAYLGRQVRVSHRPQYQAYSHTEWAFFMPVILILKLYGIFHFGFIVNLTTAIIKWSGAFYQPALMDN